MAQSGPGLSERSQICPGWRREFCRDDCTGAQESAVTNWQPWIAQGRIGSALMERVQRAKRSYPIIRLYGRESRRASSQKWTSGQHCVRALRRTGDDSGDSSGSESLGFVVPCVFLYGPEAEHIHRTFVKRFHPS
jgi:hypothetical protein